MKITREVLDKIEPKMAGKILGFHDEIEPMFTISFQELIRLARLGLWADEFSNAIHEGLRAGENCMGTPMFEEALVSREKLN